MKFVYTKGNIQLSTSFKVCPQEIDNFYLKDIHVHMYMHFEKIWSSKIFVIDKNVQNTGFKILTVLKVLAYPKIKKIKYNKRYIKILLAQQECIFPEWPLQQHWNSQSELYTDSWIQRANSGPQN